jgi:hypothetical protein
LGFFERDKDVKCQRLVSSITERKSKSFWDAQEAASKDLIEVTVQHYAKYL